ncbi:glycosyltransferase family 4 protein [Phycicoccus sp. DTK01]|uniref:glycosyltransferase family 4 protein n=1 Tax=Phycicoccus sp. DTK01 TaxID=2785745 RepID=UPI001A90CB91|nr:glycosyltransferase family 4 protein [Phycicoccus sp. DTK01]GIL34358.1 GDP-mannose-dependent alpha-(1-2)-phosphatidylinositol mannosyltransferase [Phycicoccus sp. DTK01]
MRIGIVCPYSWDVPGGVQFHVRDLAEVFIAQGHDVSVLAPADEDSDLPPYLTSCGRAVPVRYNGSVARLTFGPVTSARVTRWLETGGFDVVHLHEPVTPSVSLMALWAAEEPVVATFHTSTVRSRAMHAANPLLRPSLEKIRARIAVSEDAARTVRRHLGGDTYIIPNGVHVDAFDVAPRRPEWTGTPDAPTLAFLGRVDEPRKGLGVALAALPAVLDAHPRARLLVAGPGEADDLLKRVEPRVAAATVVLGAVSDADKASLLRSVDAYLAPHLGGESFGIVLVEAMAAGAPVVASDLSAFVAVLDGGRVGVTFEAGSAAALGEAVVGLLADPARREHLSREGRDRARTFDWSRVSGQVMAVYETVLEGAHAELAEPPRGLWSRFVRSVPGTGGS